MRLEALLFMMFMFAICLGGFFYALYLSYKNR